MIIGNGIEKWTNIEEKIDKGSDSGPREWAPLCKTDAGHQANVLVVDLVSGVDNAYTRGTPGVYREESIELSRSGGMCKVRKAQLYKGKKEGGLGFWDIPAKVAALKTTWVVKYMLNKLSLGLLEAWEHWTQL